MRRERTELKWCLTIGLIIAVAVAVAFGTCRQCCGQDAEPTPPGEQRVGPAKSRVIVPTGQLITPAGKSILFGGRPVDIALSPDGTLVFVKCTDGLLVLDAKKWQALSVVPIPKGEAGSMHGITVSRDGAAVYMSCSFQHLLEGRQDEKGQWKWTRAIRVGGDKVNPCGVALMPSGRTACVALSINNTLAIVDLAAGKVTNEIPTGVCPFGVVLAADGKTAYVSNFGGRHARKGEHTEKSVGTPVVVDERSIPITGTVTRIDIAERKATGELEVGLHPAGMAMSPDGSFLYVANANSDSVSVIDTAAFKVRETISVRPDPQLPFGSITNAVAVSKDGGTLFAANGGNNAIAVVRLSPTADTPSKVRGFIPTGWFPGAVCFNKGNLYVADVKGIGSRGDNPQAKSWNSKKFTGTVTRVTVPDDAQLSRYTRVAKTNQEWTRRDREKAASGVESVPVPQHVGERSRIEHVVYVIKENRTYDQVFGDMPKGNGLPRLCTYGREVTPNHHALADEFVLLDNYYCNGVVSADGHQWATQGAVSDYQEKSFGEHPRSYDFGTDPLTYANCNFLWDSALLAGRSFRNYGEFDFPKLVPEHAHWFAVYNDFRAGAGKIGVRQSVQMETLRKYTCPNYPGWNLAISDAQRIEVFLKEFKENEKSGQWPNLVIVYLPQDHTGGVKKEFPTPRAMVADNDLAVGRLVDAISHSRFWAKTAIFVNEDDPQDGWDHVDGHRSLCLVVSPYVKRRAVVSQFYNQLSVLHTMERILGLPGTAQLVAQAPTMEACFTATPDLAPYAARPNNIPLDERNGQADILGPKGRELVRAGEAMDLTQPDRIDDDIFNRILWHASRGIDTPYPAELAGAHGKGLKGLGLKAEQ